jgi:hypothetical protein
MISRRLGDRSKNPNKYKDDAEILIKALEEFYECNGFECIK